MEYKIEMIVDTFLASIEGPLEIANVILALCLIAIGGLLIRGKMLGNGKKHTQVGLVSLIIGAGALFTSFMRGI